MSLLILSQAFTMPTKVVWHAIGLGLCALPALTIRRCSPNRIASLNCIQRFQQTGEADDDTDSDDAETRTVAEIQTADEVLDDWSSNQEAKDEEEKRHDDEELANQVHRDTREEKRQIAGEAAKETAMITHDVESESELEEEVKSREDNEQNTELKEEERDVIEEAEESIQKASDLAAETAKIRSSNSEPLQAKGKPTQSENVQEMPQPGPALLPEAWMESREDLGSPCDKPEVPAKCPQVRKKLREVEEEEQSLEEEEEKLSHTSDDQVATGPPEALEEEFRQMEFSAQTENHRRKAKLLMARGMQVRTHSARHPVG